MIFEQLGYVGVLVLHGQYRGNSFSIIFNCELLKVLV